MEAYVLGVVGLVSFQAVRRAVKTCLDVRRAIDDYKGSSEQARTIQVQLSELLEPHLSQVIRCGVYKRDDKALVFITGVRARCRELVGRVSSAPSSPHMITMWACGAEDLAQKLKDLANDVQRCVYILQTTIDSKEKRSEMLARNWHYLSFQAERCGGSIPQRITQLARHDVRALLDSEVEDLSLANKGVDDGLIDCMWSVLAGKYLLTRLDLYHNNIGPGAQALSSTLTHLGCIQWLDVSRNNLGDEGTSNVAQALAEHGCIRWLNLSSNGVTCEQADLAQHLSPLPSLRRLGLSGNRIGDTGARVLLPALGGLTQLQCLDLEANELHDVTIDAFKDLSKLRGLSKLKLILRRNRFTSAGRDVLRTEFGDSLHM